MAKKQAKKQGSGVGVYIFSGVLLAVVIGISIALMAAFYQGNQRTYTATQQKADYINTVNEDLLSVNRYVLMVVAGIGSPYENISNITLTFDHAYKAMDDYENLVANYKSNYKETAELEKRRYEAAKTFTKAYRKKLDQFQDNYTQISGEDINNIYIQEVYPLQSTATEMFRAVVDISAIGSEREIAGISVIFNMLVMIMGIMLLIGETAIFIVAGIAKRQAAEIARREAQVAAFDSKLKRSNQKMSDFALTNILTGMKNRYALDNDISGRLDSDQFNVAVFDLDNFRSINDTYGYEFGDEYLSQVADKLTSDFGNLAEIYNITGNEFCFVFNNSVSDSQAMSVAQNVLTSMGSIYTINNLGVQLTASGSVYHYLPGDCGDLNALLAKLDNVLRNVKRNGGNGIAEVTGI
ncbi:MAG: GGDEF domain-containing protein [Oscillospiraceae bacterium]|nr:GGDEF domain-containing protein [Oscillospiraceae bacterium]